MQIKLTYFVSIIVFCTFAQWLSNQPPLIYGKDFANSRPRG